MDQTPSISPEEAGELRDLLNETLKVSKENNKILHRMRYWGRVAFWSKVLIWGLILALPLLLYSYFAPLLNTIPGTGGTNLTGSSGSVFGFPTPADVEKLLNISSSTSQ
jgi:hypothetical protein